MSSWSKPWDDAAVADEQRALVDRQLAGVGPTFPGPKHFAAFCSAVAGTNCPGTILEVGCGSGYGREVLDRVGVSYARYIGMDTSQRAITLAMERYPESVWLCSDITEPGHRRPEDLGVVGLNPFVADVVVDGSLLLHVEDWKMHLEVLTGASRRWVILHRVPVGSSAGARYAPTQGYGKEFPAWDFDRDELVAEMSTLGFEQTAEEAADGASVTMTFARPRHWVTYCDRNYLGRLKALHASMVRHCGPLRLHVLAWDREAAAWGVGAEGVTVTLAAEFMKDHPELHPERLPGPPRSLVEHYWTCGPAFIADVMGQTGEPVTYVDADIMFHSSPEPVFAEVGGAPAAVFPHNFAPASAGLPGPTMESHSIFGAYNVGLVYIAEPSIAHDWSSRCRQWCYDRVEEIESTGGPVPIADRRLRYGDQGHLEQIVREWNSR